jgi:hypothetical protein
LIKEVKNNDNNGGNPHWREEKYTSKKEDRWGVRREGDGVAQGMM